jgi:hypothetical protein
MRELWQRYSDPDVRRLLLEIQHLRGVLSDVERLRATVERAWKDAESGQLAALYQLRLLLQRERERTGRINNEGEGV